MGLADFVALAISVSGGSGVSRQGLNVPLVAAYHTVSTSRVLIYSTATALSSMVAAGFSVNSPAYKAAAIIASAPNPPAQIAIGRRANPPLQSLQLKCVDGTVNDAYAFTIVGSDGKSHAVQYSNVVNPGPAIPASNLTGTATVTQGSTAITFTSSQTLAAGQLLTFSNQTGQSYALASAVSGATTGTLTTPFTGASGSGLTVTPGATTSLTNGSTAVTFSAAQSLSAGALVSFAAQPGTFYALASAVVSSTSGTLTQAFQGPTTAASQTQSLAPLTGTFNVTNGSAIVPTSASQVAAINPGDSVSFAGQTGTFNTELALNTTYTVLTVTASQITLTQPYGGVTSAAGTAALVCQSTTAATNIQYQLALLSLIGTPTVSGQTVTIARTDGNLNDIQGWLANGFASIQLTDATADPGIAQDLNAIQAANNGAWYGLVLDSNSKAEIEAAAAWAEATGVGGKYLFWNNSDYANTQTSVTTDVFSALEALTYERDFGQQNNSQLLCYAGAAACSYALGQNPGSYALGYKSEPGVPADSDTTLTETQALAINTMTAGNPGPGGKKGNYYKTAGGLNFVWPGCTPAGEWVDVEIGIDWLQVNMQADVIGVLSGVPKTGFDDFGIGRVGDAIKSRLKLGSTPTYGLILPDGQDPARPIAVTVPTAASLTSAQRQSRNLSGVSWSAGLDGAILTASVSGTLIP